MPMKRFSILFWSLFFLNLGCAPQASSEQKKNLSTPIQRPVEGQNTIHRNLQIQNDLRISYCEVIDQQNETYSGLRDSQLFPLASLSKVVTSAWALSKLGPDFRFNTQIYFNPVLDQSGVFDVYLRTNYDPVINIEKILFYISQLNISGVKRIRNLLIDESTRVYLSVLQGPHVELDAVPISSLDSIENLKLILNSENWGENTKRARQKLIDWQARKNLALSLPSSFSVENVSFRSAELINLQNYKYKKVIQSAPLTQYLKNMNTYSNNYMSQALFQILGGKELFKDFQKNQLNLISSDLEIWTGSGLSVEEKSIRRDNKGTCFGMLQVLSYFKKQADTHQINLGELLLNPTVDQDGTFDLNSDYQNALVVKTGRLFEVPALNLAGSIATKKGDLLFVFLGHDFSENEASEIESLRQKTLAEAFQFFSIESRYTTSNYDDLFL